MASDWLGLAMALGTAAAQGYMAKKNVDAQKKDAQHAQDEWERAMQMQQQNMYEARNSPFAKIGMTMLDQMLHVYGDQTKGRGGFTLPVDQLSSMLGGFGSFGNAENGQTLGGWNPDATTGWGFGGGGASAGYDNPGLSRRSEPSTYGPAYGGKITDMRGPAGAMSGDDMGGRGSTMSSGLTDEQARILGQVVPDSMSIGDAARNALWAYAGLDKNLLGKKGTFWGDMAQRGVKGVAGKIPYIGLAARPILDKADKTFSWMYDYDNWGNASEGVWNISPHRVNSYIQAMDRSGGDPVLANAMMGYGASYNDPSLASILSSIPVTNQYTAAIQAQQRAHPSDWIGAITSGETGNFLY